MREHNENIDNACKQRKSIEKKQTNFGAEKHNNKVEEFAREVLQQTCLGGIKKTGHLKSSKQRSKRKKT